MNSTTRKKKGHCHSNGHVELSSLSNSILETLTVNRCIQPIKPEAARNQWMDSTKTDEKKDFPNRIGIAFHNGRRTNGIFPPISTGDAHLCKCKSNEATRKRHGIHHSVHRTPQLSHRYRFISEIQMSNKQKKKKFVGVRSFRPVSARLSLERHYPFTYYFPSSCRAVSEKIQSSFRAVLEQF